MTKSKILKIFLIFIALHITHYTLHKSFAQDSPKLVTLSKQIMEAKDNEQLYASFKELKDLYFKENKYNEFVEFLNSLIKQKKTLEPAVNYYVALTRYHQLKYLEEKQKWDEYFNQGNVYREELTQSAQFAVDSLGPGDILSVYTRLILWKFHHDQQDALSETAASDLMDSVFTYAKDAKDLVPIKDVAEELSDYGEKAKAKTIYSLYVNRLIASDIKDDDLKKVAFDFYKEGNLDLSEPIYDAYIERISQSTPLEKLIPILVEIAKTFSYKDKEPHDAVYAEKIFKRIEDIAGKDAFDEELLYLRAFKLEKAKEYKSAKDGYVELVKRYPQTVHNDEADFKTGIIYTYMLRDIKTGKTYFEKLSQKEILSPQVISSLYQLGLLSQWEEDLVRAKEYYGKLIEKAGDGFIETTGLAKERIREIEEQKPIEYNLKTFLDVSLKEEYTMLDMSKLDLKSRPYIAKKNEDVSVNSTTYTAESGCFQVALQFLWSGHLGTAKPPIDEGAFNTTYTHSGTKEVNLVVVSPNGIIDRNIDIIDIQ